LAVDAYCDPHLVEIGIGRERLEAGVLILPAEAPDPGRAHGFEHGHDDR